MGRLRKQNMSCTAVFFGLRLYDDSVNKAKYKRNLTLKEITC